MILYLIVDYGHTRILNMESRRPVGVFILAGGQSSRMGREKGLLPFAGQPLVVHLARLVGFAGDAPIIVGPSETYAGLGFRVIADDQHGVGVSGPLVGICTALRVAAHGWNLIVGCDLPFLTREWLEFLIARALDSPADVVIPRNERGYEPLCAMYRRQCYETIAAALERSVRKITDGLAGLTVAAIAPAEWKAFDARGRLFKNVNTPADYEEARAAAGETA
jgi:molybdenum cofactor guanylyltransferase